MRLLFLLFLCAQVWASPWAVLHTSMGDIVLELNENQAPITTHNFVRYAQSGFYNGTIFHRVIPGFVVQGGGYTTQLRPKATRAPIANESYNGLKNVRGTLAMARSADPHSATSQFFINLADNDFLNRGKKSGYAVFGRVVQGIKIAEAMARVPTHGAGIFSRDVPRRPIVIQRVELFDRNPLRSPRTRHHKHDQEKKHGSLSHQSRHHRH